MRGEGGFTELHMEGWYRMVQSYYRGYRMVQSDVYRVQNGTE